MKGAGIFALLLFVVSNSLYAQSAGQDPTQQNNNIASEDDTIVYEPYEDEEFPEWLQDLRRAEVVFVGSFPIAMLFSSLAYDGYRLVRSGIEEGGFSGAEIGSYTSDEGVGLLVAGLSVSAIVSILDFVLGKL